MANTGFVVNTHRFDPYKNFKFRIIWDNKTVLGVSKASALKRTTEVVKHRSGGENSIDHKSPGRTSYEGITLERGITHDPEFEAWELNPEEERYRAQYGAAAFSAQQSEAAWNPTKP